MSIGDGSNIWNSNQAFRNCDPAGAAREGPSIPANQAAQSMQSSFSHLTLGQIFSPARILLFLLFENAVLMCGVNDLAPLTCELRCQLFHPTSCGYSGDVEEPISLTEVEPSRRGAPFQDPDPVGWRSCATPSAGIHVVRIDRYSYLTRPHAPASAFSYDLSHLRRHWPRPLRRSNAGRPSRNSTVLSPLRDVTGSGAFDYHRGHLVRPIPDYLDHFGRKPLRVPNAHQIEMAAA